LRPERTDQGEAVLVLLGPKIFLPSGDALGLVAH
jgi:hypothetical protein